MRSEAVGLVEVLNPDPVADVTRLEAADAGDTRVSLRASHRRPGQSSQRPTSTLFSAFRSTMSSWRSEKPKSAVTVEYVAVGDEDDGEGGNVRMAHHKPRQILTWHTYLLGLALLSIILLVVDVSETVGQHLLKVRGSNRDPLGNWGKPGTGTEDLSWYPTDFLRDVLPVPCHSHNDYWRKIPLFTAIYTGCSGVEADVWLRNGDLLVGHNTASLQPNRTFRSLYVNPLVEILTNQNPQTDFYKGTKNGVFDTDPEQTLVLLVDIKTNGAETWPWVMEQLLPLRERGWLSYSEDGQFHRGPITVVGTGNAPFDQIVVGNETYREAFFDAPLEKLANSTFDSTNSYYASVNFWNVVGPVWWKGGPGQAQLEKIRGHLREARERGLVSRYWGLPSWPIHVRNKVWEILVEEGIGMLNVDDLDAAIKQDWTKPGTF